ncbi:hypothetical protein KGY73_06895 [bacterium]|nr:hypothetical protein [bacterium]
MRLKGLKLFLPIGVCVLLLFSILQTDFLSGISLASAPQKSFHMVEAVIQLIRNDYVEKPNPSQTMAGAFRGIANSLDPLSCYLTPQNVAQYQKETPLQETGLILYKTPDTFPQVIGIKENSPAQKKDIQIGDFISSIDNQSTLHKGMIEVNLLMKEKIKEESEAPVNLKILREGKSHKIKVKRKLLNSRPFSYVSSEGTSGILKIHNLYPSCVQKIRDQVLSEIKGKRKPLILDLRNCYQGHFTEAQKLINLFIRSDNIGYLSKKNGEKESLSCPRTPELKKIPLRVWINQATFGPAEAAAGVLKDKKRAKLVGFPSLGLAARLRLYSLEDGSGVILVSRLFHLPSGKIIWEEGIQPGIKIKGKDQSTEAFLQKTLSTSPET